MSEITWLDAQLIGQYPDAVCSGERHILALVEALALGSSCEAELASVSSSRLGVVVAPSI
jgi:hypothetical protein